MNNKDIIKLRLSRPKDTTTVLDGMVGLEDEELISILNNSILKMKNRLSDSDNLTIINLKARRIKHLGLDLIYIRDIKMLKKLIFIINNIYDIKDLVDFIGL